MRAPTVEQVVGDPASAARPATPFGAIPTNVDALPPSGPDTRIDAPAGKRAPTQAAGPRSQTLSLGVLPQQPPQDTFAAAPLHIDSRPRRSRWKVRSIGARRRATPRRN